ncbi:MAG: SMC-Scp complex subunit ScpB [Pirellulales bacterium]
MSPQPADRSPSADDSLGLGAFRHLPEQAGLSLNQLSEALSGMLRTGDDPYTAPAESAGEDAAAEDAARDADAACEITPRTILEAMLFVGHPANEPLSSKQVAGLMRGVRPAEIDALVRELNRDYAARNSPYAIVAEGPGYRLQLREEFARLRDQFYGKARRARLSQAAIEVLAAVAYHQPIAAEEVNRLRGMPCGPILLQLVRRQLLGIERDEAQPRRAIYRTTDRFLALFNLANLDELPRGADLDEQ